MKTELILFVSQFIAIFAMGFQQQNVHARKFVSAALTSVLIGVAQMLVLRGMPKAGVSGVAAWLLAGPLAIVCAMWIHPKLFKKPVDKLK